MSVPCFGNGVEAALVVEWARAAEVAGWDGFFLWDHPSSPFLLVRSMPSTAWSA